MARIVYVTSGLVGILNSGLELARRLQVAGHDVTFVGWRDSGRQIEQQGFGFVRLDDDERALEQVRDRIAEVGRIRALPLARRLRRRLLESTEIEDTLRRLEPDLLIIDVEVHTAVIASRSLSIPTVLRIDFLSIYRNWNTPPLHTELAAPTNLPGRLSCWAAWVRTLVSRGIANTLGQLRPRAFSTRVGPFKYGTVSRHTIGQFARARGLRLREFTSWTDWLRPHVYPTIPLISSTASELELPGTDRGNLQYVGPLIHANHVDINTSASDRARWERTRDEATQLGRPIVYCGLGTLNPQVLVRVRNVIAAAHSAEWTLVVGLGGSARASELDELPDNVLVLDYAPQLEVLAVANAAVIHGGINTINECISHDVPMVVHRGGLVDQPGGAVRVEHHGLGIRVDIDDDETDIGQSLNRVLTEPEFLNNVISMRKAFERYRGVLEDFIESVLGGEHEAVDVLLGGVSDAPNRSV